MSHYNSEEMFGSCQEQIQFNEKVSNVFSNHNPFFLQGVVFPHLFHLSIYSSFSSSWLTGGLFFALLALFSQTMLSFNLTHNKPSLLTYHHAATLTAAILSLPLCLLLVRLLLHLLITAQTSEIHLPQQPFGPRVIGPHHQWLDQEDYITLLLLLTLRNRHLSIVKSPRKGFCQVSPNICWSIILT